MRFFHSQNNFLQHRPYQNWWRRLRKLHQRRVLTPPKHCLPALHNPYHEKGSHPFWRSRMLWVIILLTLIAWIGLLIFLPYFRITEFSYSGLRNVRANNITNFVLQRWWQQSKLFPANNYFFVRSDNLAKVLRERFKLDAVVVNKIFPNQLKIQITEKNTTIIYFNGEQYFLLDTNGAAVLEQPTASIAAISATNTLITNVIASSTVVASPTTTLINSSNLPDRIWAQKKLGDYPLLFDKRKLNPNYDPISEILIRSIITWDDLLRQRGIARVDYYILEDISAGLRIIINKPWQLLVGLEKIDTQADYLKSILQTAKPVEYIDLRFGDRVYWR